MTKDNPGVIAGLEDALANAKIDLRMAKARECRMQTAIRWALGELGGFHGREEGQGAYWWRTELRERSALAASGPCEHAEEVERLKALCGEAAPFLDDLARHLEEIDGLHGIETGLAARLRAAAKGGGECRMREAVKTYVEKLESGLDRMGGDDPLMSIQRLKLQPLRAALAASGPCEHEAEIAARKEHEAALFRSVEKNRALAEEAVAGVERLRKLLVRTADGMENDAELLEEGGFSNSAESCRMSIIELRAAARG
jgi:hypothetical protein